MRSIIIGGDILACQLKRKKTREEEKKLFSVLILIEKRKEKDVKE
jgi:hypothetical protein